MLPVRSLVFQLVRITMGTLSTILLLLHLATPIAAGVFIALRGRRQRRNAMAAAGVLLLIAIGIGFGASFAYASSVRGRLPAGQVIVASYSVLCVVCVLWGLNVALRLGLDKLFRVTRQNRGTTRATLAQTARAALLYAIALPYLMGVTLVFRPKVTRIDDPTSLLNVSFDRITFPAADGQRVAAWWIPAAAAGDGSTNPFASAPAGTRTVILCHGFMSDKVQDLPLARDLVPAGFNVLAIDLRGHGESGGQLAGFGHAERNDVLGAVKWLRSSHPQACHKIFGLGRNAGAAALLAAAADPSPEGQSIDALALYAAYDDPASVVGPASSRMLLPPLDAIVRKAAMPVAGLLSGSGPGNGSPLADVQRLWPRPVLFIHGQADKVVPFDAGLNLYDHALQPKYHYWVPKADGKQVIDDEMVSKAVRLFFEYAKTML